MSYPLLLGSFASFLVLLLGSYRARKRVERLRGVTGRKWIDSTRRALSRWFIPPLIAALLFGVVILRAKGSVEVLASVAPYLNRDAAVFAGGAIVSLVGYLVSMADPLIGLALLFAAADFPLAGIASLALGAWIALATLPGLALNPDDTEPSPGVRR